MDPVLEDLIIFYTRYSSYKYKVLSFRLINGLATYQRYINKILFNYLNKFCTAYLDNILIYSNNKLKHQVYVKKVLERLQNTGLQVNIKKYKFRVEQIKYLRFIISIEGIKVNPKKVKVIHN